MPYQYLQVSRFKVPPLKFWIDYKVLCHTKRSVLRPKDLWSKPSSKEVCRAEEKENSKENLFTLLLLFFRFLLSLSSLNRQIYSRFYITFHSTPDKVESRRNGRCFSQYLDGLLWADFEVAGDVSEENDVEIPYSCINFTTIQNIEHSACHIHWMAVPASTFQNRRYFTQLYEPSSKPHYRNLALQQIIQTQNAGASERVCGERALCSARRRVSREWGSLAASCESYYTSSLLNGVCYGPRGGEERVASRQSLR